MATCIAEEGLDIGAVDLIINFDSLTSPIRMVQRRGRTGRKRTGRSVTLLTEGNDERKYRESNRLATKLMTLLKHSNSYLKFLPSVRMLPPQIVPKISKREMVFQEFRSSQIGGRDRQRQSDTDRERVKDLKSGVLSKSQRKTLDDEYVVSQESKCDIIFAESYYDEEEEEEKEHRFVRLCRRNHTTSLTIPQPVHCIRHSHRTSILMDSIVYIKERGWEKEMEIFKPRDRKKKEVKKKQMFSWLDVDEGDVVVNEDSEPRKHEEEEEEEEEKRQY